MVTLKFSFTSTFCTKVLFFFLLVSSLLLWHYVLLEIYTKLYEAQKKYILWCSMQTPAVVLVKSSSPCFSEV